MDSLQSQAETLCLPTELTIAEVDEYRQRMAAMLDAGKGIAIDASATTHIDTASLQLFYIFQKALADSGQGIQWVAVSKAFSESAGLLGLATVLALPESA